MSSTAHSRAARTSSGQSAPPISGYLNRVGDERDVQITALAKDVRVLSAGLGLDESYEIPPEVRRQVEAGETINAIRTLRRQAPGRLSLVAAKRMVDADRIRVAPLLPWTMPPPGIEPGTFGLRVRCSAS